MIADFTFPHELALTAIIKDEAPYIAEWLDYHIAAGVSKFYIYDNESTDDVRDILMPYMQDGTVEYVFYPGKYRQLDAYNESLFLHRFDCRYMGFIDIDEFLLPLRQERLIDVLDDVMAAAPSSGGGVAGNCKSFGSSGHKTMPDGGVLKNYLHRASDGYDWSVFPWKWDAHVKTIANPRRIRAVVSPHYPAYCWNCWAVDENGNRVDGVDNFVPATHRIRVNHYFTKSRAEWLAKQQKGKADVAGLRPVEEFEWRDRNDVFDDTIVKYFEWLKMNPAPKRKAPEQKVFTLLNYFLQELDEHREKDYYQGEIERLLCFWQVGAKERQSGGDGLFADLLEQTLLEMCSNALGAARIVPAQAELLLSVWEGFGQNPTAAKKQLRANLITVLKGFIEVFRSRGDQASERYFTDALQEFLIGTTG